MGLVCRCLCRCFCRPLPRASGGPGGSVTALNLLTQPLIRVQAGRGPVQRLTLPQLLARLSAAQVLDFPMLRPHQQPAWHAFLVQLAFLALELTDSGQPPDDPGAWAMLLRGLTPKYADDAPWCLVVDDWQQPAFLQSPCRAGAEADYKRVLASAQEIDLLITSKNHDEKVGKMARITADDADLLVYALVSLQGFAGGLGPGKRNSMRVNGYYGSRAQFRLAFDRGAGPEFLRDLTVLLANAEALRDQAIYEYGIGTALQYRLLWLAPWGLDPLPLSAIHPMCLEVCRRVRLRWNDGVVQALTATSTTTRVAAEMCNGNVMDPWGTLVKEGVVRALSAKSFSFQYRSLAPILFNGQKYALPLLAKPTAKERNAGVLVVQVLVNEQGLTDGLLRREIPMRGVVLRKFADARGELALRAQQFIEIASNLQGKVLRPALLQYIDGSAEPDWKNGDFAKYVAPWIVQFDQQVDEVFYPALFDTVEAELADHAAQAAWLQTLLGLAREIFARAAEALPSRDGSRLIALARAQRVMSGGLLKQFGDLLPAQPSTASQHAAALAPLEPHHAQPR